MQYAVLVVVVALAGASGDVACPYGPGEARGALNARLDSCAMPSEELVEGIVSTNTTAAYRVFLRGRCSVVPRTRACMAAVATQAAVCLDATETIMFDINRDFLDTALEILCRDDGDRLAVMLGDEIDCLDPVNELLVFNCLNATVTAMTEEVADDTAYTLRRYRAIRSFKECVEDIAQCQQAGEKALKSLIDEILARMKCFSRDNLAVSCELLE